MRNGGFNMADQNAITILNFDESFNNFFNDS